MTRLGAVGDIHFGQGVSSYGPQRLQDQADALTQAFRIFKEHGCDAVLIPGDIFEGPTVTPAEYVAFARALEVLDGMPVVACLGNGRHDLATRPVNALHVFDAMYAPDRLTIRCEPAVVTVAGVQVACLPWTSTAGLVAHRGGGDRSELFADAAELLHATAQDLRDSCDGPAVLMLHWSISGATTPTGMLVDAGLFHEPVLDLARLEALGFDAVVASHIHRPQILNLGHDDNSDAGPIFYTGSPLPLNHGEASCRHGCWILENDADVGAPLAFHPIESRAFLTLNLGSDNPHDSIDSALVHAATDAIVRVRSSVTEEQARRIDHRQIREALAGAFHVSIEPTILRATRARAHMDDGLTEVDALARWADTQDIPTERRPELVERTTRYLTEARS